VFVAEKYHCPTCGRRFVEWGAKKMEFICPSEGCDHVKLILSDSDSMSVEAKPKSKRTRRSKSIVPVTNPEESPSELDNEFSLADAHDFSDETDKDIDDVDDEDEPVILEKE